MSLRPSSMQRLTALAALAFLTACGGGGDATAPGSSDTTAPTVTITDSEASATATGPVTFTFTFSEVVSGFVESDIAVTGGSKGSFSMAGDGRSATLLVTPTANSAGTLNVSVAAAAFVDAANNANTASASATQAYDTRVATPATTIATFDESPNAATLLAFEGTSFESATEGSNKVAKLNKPRTAQPWGGATLHTCPAGTDGDSPAIPFTANAKSISVMVKAPRAGVVFTMKAEGVGTNAGAGVFTQTTNTGTEWEKLTFNFANKSNGTDLDITKVYNKFSIYPNWTEVSADTANRVAETADRVYLFDDFKLEGVSSTLAACPPSQAPSAAASVPTLTPALTLFSDASGYTAPEGVTFTWRTGWSAADFTADTVAGNNVPKYAILDYVGVEPSATLNASSGNYLNLDIWTPNISTFRIKLVDFGANGTYAGGDDTEHEVVVDTSSTKSQWRRLRIPMGDFVNLAARAHIGQIIFSSVEKGTIYIDNVFFSTN